MRALRRGPGGRAWPEGVAGGRGRGSTGQLERPRGVRRPVPGLCCACAGRPRRGNRPARTRGLSCKRVRSRHPLKTTTRSSSRTGAEPAPGETPSVTADEGARAASRWHRAGVRTELWMRAQHAIQAAAASGTDEMGFGPRNGYPGISGLWLSCAYIRTYLSRMLGSKSVHIRSTHTHTCVCAHARRGHGASSRCRTATPVFCSFRTKSGLSYETPMSQRRTHFSPLHLDDRRPAARASAGAWSSPARGPRSPPSPAAPRPRETRQVSRARSRKREAKAGDSHSSH